MIRCLCLFVLLSLNLASAQRRESYVGVGLTNLTVVNIFPVLSGQLGGPVAENLEAKVTLETILIGTLLSVDLLYTAKLDDEVSLYLGAGPNVAVIFAAGGGGLGLGGHVEGGVLYRPGGSNVGLYAALRPLVLFAENPQLDLHPRLGVNFYF